jgi:hypothetical protein
MRPLAGQMHKVAAPEEVVRAIGVYEWTGDMAKPAASRLIPVSLFIDGQLQDAGVYLSRPVPFALDRDTVYEVDEAGISKGTIDLLFARHLVAADLASGFDDGWFGYGTFRGPPKPKPVTQVAKTTRPRRVRTAADDDPDRPHFIRHEGGESDADAASGGSTGSGSTASQTSAASAPAPPDDPDRPHLSRHPDSSSGTESGTASGTAGGTASGTSGGASGSGSASGGTAGTTGASGDSTQTASDSGSGSNSSPSSPAGDPDRPTLKKRTPEEAKQARKESSQSSVSGESTSLNDDPNRPMLHRGQPAHALTETDFPKLKGVPADIHQMVAVSDAKNREPHDFAREWADAAEKATVLEQMQALARSSLTAYEAKNGASAPAAPPAAAHAPAPAASGTGVHNNVRRKKTVAPAPPPEPLLDEQLKGYTLSYGGADTFVYMAHTDGDGATLRYVTVVAQRDPMGTLKTAIQSVTDAAHLDRTPWLRLVDVVDAEASNRASLLFEVRGQTERQFALYRVIAARADQTLLTGTTQ